MVAAYNELRSELAKSKFGKEYAECSEEEKDAIMDYYPQKISEAEPKKIRRKKEVSKWENLIRLGKREMPAIRIIFFVV